MNYKNKASEILVISNHLERTLLAAAHKFTASRKIFLLYDQRFNDVAQSVSRQAALKKFCVATHAFRASEQKKNLTEANKLYQKMFRAGLDRQSLVVAIGGGVVTDLAGFVAGTYMRGIPWIAVPTTLLAQVDAAIGGKTAVNTVHGKNLVGVFHMPACIICDVGFIEPLPRREIISGLGEMMKMGIAFDAKYFNALLRDKEKLINRESRHFPRHIKRAIELKIKIVSQDPFEERQGGTSSRKLLNFGHTLAHALESTTDYKFFRHGEAVILGMRFASYISLKEGYLPQKKFEAIEKSLQQFAIQWPNNISKERLMKALKLDKKNTGAGFTFILLADLGKAFVAKALSERRVDALLHEFLLLS